MSSSESPKTEIKQDFSDITPNDVFKYPNEASKIIWQVNSSNILQSSSKIIDLINSNKITVEMAFYLISFISKLRAKDIKLFAELYQKMSSTFS